MPASANVRSIQALDDLKDHLARFRSEATEALDLVAGEIERTRRMLSDLEQRWKQRVWACEQEVQQWQTRLQRCLAAAEDRSGAASCAPLRAALVKAQQELAHAQAVLAAIRRRIQMVEGAVAAFHQRAAPVSLLLHNDLPKAAATLGSSASRLRAYAASDIVSSVAGLGIFASSTAPPAANNRSLPLAPEAATYGADQLFSGGQGRQFLLRTDVSANNCWVRVHDPARAPQPGTPRLGEGGFANLRLERGDDGQVVRVRLEDIFTEERHRGAGLGSRMLAQAEVIARAHGAQEIYGAAPHVDDQVTRGWYVRRGYSFRSGFQEEIYKVLS